jgi:hypothetical protein
MAKILKSKGLTWVSLLEMKGDFALRTLNNCRSSAPQESTTF